MCKKIKEVKPLKLVSINSVSGFGSTGKIVNDLSAGLDGLDYKNYVIYGRKKSTFKNALKVGGHINVLSHLLKTRVFGKHGFYSKYASRKLIKLLKKLDPDIIHLHNLHGYYLNVEILFKYLAKAKIPVVWTLHDCWSFTGHCAHYDFVDCQKWQRKCHNCPQLKVYYKSWFFDRSSEAYKDKKALFNLVENMTIVTPSNWLKNEVKKSFLAHKRVQVIYNGIDLNLFKPRPSTFRKDNNLSSKFIILGVASVWDQRKGLDYFIELSENLSKDEVIVLLGLSKTQVSNLPKNIIKLERTNSSSELAEIYSASDVYVNLTLEETLGLTNIEAMACGTPTITFNTGGSPETIDKDTGITVSKGSIDEVMAAVKKIKLNGKDFYKDACISRAKNHFSKEEAFENYVNLYKNLVSKNREKR